MIAPRGGVARRARTIEEPVYRARGRLVEETDDARAVTDALVIVPLCGCEGRS